MKEYMEVAIETKKNNGYFAVALDKESCNVAKRNAEYEVIVGNHITLAYKPNNKTFKKLNKLCGKKVEVYINEMRANENIQAYWVSNMYLTPNKKLERVDNGPAHITISHRKGFKSGDANSMFKRPTFKEERLGMLEGRVKWIQFKEKK